MQFGITAQFVALALALSPGFVFSFPDRRWCPECPEPYTVTVTETVYGRMPGPTGRTRWKPTEWDDDYDDDWDEDDEYDDESYGGGPWKEEEDNKGKGITTTPTAKEEKLAQTTQQTTQASHSGLPITWSACADCPTATITEMGQQITSVKKGVRTTSFHAPSAGTYPPPLHYSESVTAREPTWITYTVPKATAWFMSYDDYICQNDCDKEVQIAGYINQDIVRYAKQQWKVYAENGVTKTKTAVLPHKTEDIQSITYKPEYSSQKTGEAKVESDKPKETGAPKEENNQHPPAEQEGQDEEEDIYLDEEDDYPLDEYYDDAFEDSDRDYAGRYSKSKAGGHKEKHPHVASHNRHGVADSKTHTWVSDPAKHRHKDRPDYSYRHGNGGYEKPKKKPSHASHGSKNGDGVHWVKDKATGHWRKYKPKKSSHHTGHKSHEAAQQKQPVYDTVQTETENPKETEVPQRHYDPQDKWEDNSYPMHSKQKKPIYENGKVIHPVVVGGPENKNAYSPPYVFAEPGEIIRFEFLSVNHTATQSSFHHPCVKIDNGADSGYRFNEKSEKGKEVWEYTVSHKHHGGRKVPVWFFCAQRDHCKKDGMVFAVNPNKDATWEDFQKTATT